MVSSANVRSSIDGSAEAQSLVYREKGCVKIAPLGCAAADELLELTVEDVWVNDVEGQADIYKQDPEIQLSYNTMHHEVVHCIV